MLWSLLTLYPVKNGRATIQKWKFRKAVEILENQVANKKTSRFIRAIQLIYPNLDADGTSQLVRYL
jgi:hypothetical protein